MPTNDPGLHTLGLRLRAERLKRNESQSTFAARIGVSVPTLRKMESGNSTVTIGSWATALDVLDRTRDLDAVLAEPEELFAKYEHLNTALRRRASKRSL